MLKKVRCRNQEEQKVEGKVTIITELRQKFSLPLLLKITNVSSSTYYYTINKQKKIDPDEVIKNEIKSIFKKHSGNFGYRRITLALRNQGYTINHKKVARLMKVLGLYGKVSPRTKKYSSYQGDMNGTCKNVLLVKVVDEKANKTYYRRDFQTTAPNQKWATDVTEFRIAAGKLYLSPILDLNSRDIVSYTISTSPNFNQVRTMVEGALAKYPNLEGLIFQSDQGWQYQMKPYRELLKEHGIIQSMSRKGNCLDNSLIENFFGILKREMFYGHEHEFETLDELKQAIEAYIEYFNTQRISVKLKGLTPVQYRNQSLIS